MSDAKIAIVIRDDLQSWQRLNVTAFLMSRISAANPAIIGEPYKNAAGTAFLPMAIKPVIVLAADLTTLRTIHGRAIERGAPQSVYVAYRKFKPPRLPERDGITLPRRGRSQGVW